MAEAWKIVVTIFCLIGSALFSGLTLGLMSWDLVDLQVLLNSGTEQQKKYAKRIYPIRKTGNWLLVTLLTGNASVNSALSIVSADLFSGLVGFAVSTLAILYIGEIIPQSLCHRHGLFVGYYTAWIVYIFMFITSPITWPTAKILDYFLGEEALTKYNKQELKSLVELHGTMGADRQTAPELSKDETTILGAAIDFAHKTVQSVMTPLANTFMLEINTILNFKTLTLIFQSGHSRVPIYEEKRTNIVGILFTKDLILLDPDDEIPARTILSFFGRDLHSCFDDTPLSIILNEFKKGKGHMAIVNCVNTSGPGDPFYETVGIVTLEDLIEELIGSEILDETDVYKDNMRHDKVKGRRKINPAVLAMFDSSNRHREGLSRNEATAVVSFLQQHFDDIFGPQRLIDHVLKKMLLHAQVVELNDKKQVAFAQTLSRTNNILADQDDHPTFDADIDEKDDKEKDHLQTAIFKKGVPADEAILVLQGRLKIKVGEENFVSEAGPWTLLAKRAVIEDKFVPDFTATPEEFPVRYLAISRDLYETGLKMTESVRAGRDSFNEDAFNQTLEGVPTLEDLKAGKYVLHGDGFVLADQFTNNKSVYTVPIENHQASHKVDFTEALVNVTTVDMENKKTKEENNKDKESSEDEGGMFRKLFRKDKDDEEKTKEDRKDYSDEEGSIFRKLFKKDASDDDEERARDDGRDDKVPSDDEGGMFRKLFTKSHLSSDDERPKDDGKEDSGDESKSGRGFNTLFGKKK